MWPVYISAGRLAADRRRINGLVEETGLASFLFRTKAGQLKSLAVELRVEDFRGLGPLQRAANKL